jgi:hypothetical protein
MTFTRSYYRVTRKVLMIEKRQMLLLKSEPDVWAVTHRVDVRRYGAQKRAALAAHWGQVSGWGRGARLMRILLRSPWPAFRVALGTEWFAEPGGRTGELVPRHQPAEPGRS